MAKHDIDPVLQQLVRAILRAHADVDAAEDKGPFARLLGTP